MGEHEQVPQQTLMPDRRKETGVALGSPALHTGSVAPKAGRVDRAGIAALQRAAGNIAVQRLLGVQRDDDWSTPAGDGPTSSQDPAAEPEPMAEQDDGGYTPEGDGPTSDEPTSSEDPGSGQEPVAEQDDGGYTPEGDGPSSEAEPVEAEPVDDQSASALFDVAVAAGDRVRALGIVVRSKGFGGPYVASITYDPALGHDGLTSGELGIGKPQRITIGPSAFAGGYQYCASVVGHEVLHVGQRTGSVPITDNNVREFLSYSWQVLDGPPLSLADRKANAVQAMKAYGRIVNPDDKVFYQPKYDEVVSVWRQIPDAVLTQ